MWCIPAVDAEFVERMEDVLELYAERPDPSRPVVSLDEKPYPLLVTSRSPPSAPITTSPSACALSVLEEQCLARRIATRGKRHVPNAMSRPQGRCGPALGDADRTAP